MILAVIFAPLAAMLIQMTISRTREYSADRLGAEISGKPLALASALGKISAYARRILDADRRAQPGLGAALHHQPAERAADGQPLLHPSERGEPHPRAGGDGRRRRRPGPRQRPSSTRRSRPGRARSPSSAAGERGGAPGSRRGGRPRRSSRACWRRAAASASRPRRRTGRSRRSLPPSGRGRRRSRRARSGISGGSTRCSAPFLRKPPPAPAMNALRLAVAELNLDRVPAHAAVDGAVRLASGGKGRHLAGHGQRGGAAGRRGRRGALGRRPGGAAARLAGRAGRGGLGDAGGRRRSPRRTGAGRRPT